MFIIATFAYGLGHYLAGDASSDDPQGGTNPWCEDERLPSISNGADMEVSTHRTDCTTLASDSLTYVYLHRKGERESRSSLIFRYDGNDPKIRWIDNDHVSIQADSVGYIGKQVIHLDNTSVNYELAMTNWSELDNLIDKLGKNAK